MADSIIGIINRTPRWTLRRLRYLHLNLYHGAVKKRGFLLCLLLLLCSCGKPRIDENYAASVVKDKLSLSGRVTAQELKGGLSGAKIFKISSDTGRYVVRFLAHQFKEKKEVRTIHDEIICFSIASASGYGPHLYYADEQKAFVIMEYLPAQPITDKMRNSEDLYRNLASILQKIHSSSPLPQTRDLFDEFSRRITSIKIHASDSIPLDKIESIIADIKPILAPHMANKPCHNDLNPNNLIFLGTEFRTIDYERAAQSDPYFDLGTVAFFYCLKSAHENILFQSYLGRMPTPQEQSKLYLFKQVAMINYALVFLGIAADKICIYKTLQAPSLKEFFEQIAEHTTEKLDAQETKVKFAKVLINEVITNTESQEFHVACALLQQNTNEGCLC